MFLFKRLQRLFQADVNHVFDTLEDPKAMLKLSLMEMHQFLDQIQQRILDHKEQIKQSEKSITDLQEKIAQQDKNIELSLDQKDEALIKRQVKKNLEYQKMLKAKESQFQTLQQSLQDLEEEHHLKKEKLDFLEQKEALLITQQKSTSTHPIEESWHVSDDEVELEYLKTVKEKKFNKKEVT